MQDGYPAWIRKDFEHPDFAAETADWFRRIFPDEPSGPNGLRVLSRHDPDTGLASLLVQLPAPLTAEHGEWMQGWRPANHDAADLGHWQVEI